jgi:cation diffusion facilitator CzcD-associated flavoprotein CzcO
MTIDHRRVAVLGAGIAGLALVHRLHRIGVDDVVVFERSDGVGGTWRANTYPGAACDVPSHLYSLSFARKPDWSRTYAGQPEILAYVEDCYDRFDVRRHVRTGTAVVEAQWQDDRRCWRLRDDTGAHHDADVVVSAVGLFHTPALPAIDGLDDFRGECFHSARWDHGVDLLSRDVAVIGTGASAIQVVPAIAPVTRRLTLYQRTPPWILPRRDRPFTDEEKQRFARNPVAARRQRWDLYRAFEENTTFVEGDEKADELSLFSRSYLERKVPDPLLRARLQPDYPFGCKRVLVSSNYYPALQRDNVELVTDPIGRVVSDGVVTAEGVHRPCDTIILCTGFRASEYLAGVDVVGRDGRRLHDVWAGVPRAYLGMAVPGFPNFFMMYGPNTNQGGNSIIVILEAQAHYLASMLATLRRGRRSTVEVTAAADRRYATELHEALAATVWNDGCSSYFQSSSGDVVTQLPHPSRWYWWRTRRVLTRDFSFA